MQVSKYSITWAKFIQNKTFIGLALLHYIQSKIIFYWRKEV